MEGREKRTGCCLLEALALEDVPEVTAATRASDLDAGHTPALVLMTGHSAGNSYTTTKVRHISASKCIETMRTIEEGWPATARVELVV